MFELVGVPPSGRTVRNREDVAIERVVIVTADDAIRIENLDQGGRVNCGTKRVGHGSATLVRVYVGAAVGVTAVEVLVPSHVSPEFGIECLPNQSRVTDAKTRFAEDKSRVYTSTGG